MEQKELKKIAHTITAGILSGLFTDDEDLGKYLGNLLSREYNKGVADATEKALSKVRTLQSAFVKALKR